MIRLNDILDEAGRSNSLSEAGVSLIKKAYVYSAKVHAGQKRFSGEPYLSHPLEVSLILAQMGLDNHTVATGLLHDTVEDTLTTLEDIKRLFGDEISRLVDGTTKVGELSYSSDEERQAENFRKLILATARDVRIVLIKLADRLHNMKTLEVLPQERRRKISKETLEIYAPLARRLGIGWLASELEDLSFKFLNPREYVKIEHKLKKGVERRKRKIDETKVKIAKSLLDAGIKSEVSGRVKNFYSIYGKMKWQNLEFSELHDIIAFRIITESKRDCYLALGEVHRLWNPVPGRIKDYISLPKSNGYQSIHTIVISPDGDQMEVQIRTRRMHEFAEKGIAAHWDYKSGSAADVEIKRQFSRIGHLAKMENEVHPAGFMQSLKAELEPSVIYVYTPKAELIELPVGSTSLDFAYRIHTGIGNRCNEAIVNRKSVPLNTHLKTGDMVEIKVSDNTGPSEIWLKWVVTPQAKNRIRKELSKARREKSLDIGRSICERRLASTGRNLNSMMASGEILKPLKKLMMRIEKILDKVADPESRKMIAVGGETAMTRFSNCCLPVPGEKIIGHMTRGSGIVIHSAICDMRGNDMNMETIVPVQWRKDFEGEATTGVSVACGDRDEVLSSVSKIMNSLSTQVLAKETKRFEEGRKYTFLLKVRNIWQLEEIIESLSMLEGVVSVERCGRAFE